MQNTQLSKLLATFSAKELKQLKKWVASPFFNQRTDVIALFDFYLQYYKRHQIPPSKPTIFQHLFPEEPYDDHKVRVAISFLNRQTEQFLIYQQQQKECLSNQLTLLATFRERGLKKAYQKTTKGIEKKLVQTPLRNANYYRLKYRFHEEQLKSKSITKRFDPKNNFQTISDNLDLSILIEKIKESIGALDHEKISTTRYDLGLYDKLLESIKEHPRFLNNPTIAVYHAASLVVLHDEQYLYFDQYYQLLEEHHTRFSKSELLDLYNLAINYLAIRFSLGETDRSEKAFRVYKRQLELGLYDQKIAHYVFKNIVSAGIVNQAYDWVAQFIKNYTPKLPKEHQHSMSYLGLAALAWKQGQHEKALTLLTSTKFEDVVHNMTARKIILKIYYEQNNNVALQKHLRAFEAYIRRLKQTPFKQAYLEVILFTQKVCRVNPYDKKEIAKLIQTIENKPTLLERNWLLMCLKNL